MASYRNPFFYSPAPGLSADAQAALSAHQKMLKVGLNTGNMMFASALHKVLGRPEGSQWAPRVQDFDPEQVAADHDCVVVAAANWLQPRLDFGDLADKLEKTGLPCFVIGLGAQAGSFRAHPDLSDGTRRFLSLVSHRSEKIAVRGPFTAEVLKGAGIDNVEVTGCPSLLVAPHQPIAKPDRPPRRIAIAGSRGLPNDKLLTAKQITHSLSRRLSQMMLDHPVEFIAQAEMPEIDILLSGGDHAHIRPEWIEFLEKYYDAPIARISAAVVEKMKVFFETADWMDHLRGLDFVVGTRLHGTIAALIAGTPTLLIVHDSRTAEMAEIMGIPSVPGAELDLDRIDFDALYDRVDMHKFTTGLPEYRDRFIRFFEENGLQHNLAG